jgi:hypothetical protein
MARICREDGESHVTQTLDRDQRRDAVISHSRSSGRQGFQQLRWPAGGMHWHWGNIGSAAGGIAALIATVVWVDRRRSERQLAGTDYAEESGRR